MNKATDRTLKMDVYVIYLRKYGVDLEAEKLGEGETLARHSGLKDIKMVGLLAYLKTIIFIERIIALRM